MYVAGIITGVMVAPSRARELKHSACDKDKVAFYVAPSRARELKRRASAQHFAFPPRRALTGA